MNEITIYEKVQNPLEFAKEMGKAFSQSGMFGCKNEQQGVVLAMACAVERKNPIELARTYHIIDGKLSMRADAMLAEFRARGGKHRWLRTGDDHQAAEIELEFDGLKSSVTFSMEDAHRAELVKPKSGWEKYPGEMLRARVVSKAIRMIAPEIIAGCYAPEELGDDNVIDVTPVVSPKQTDVKEAMRTRKKRTTEEPAEATASAAATDAASTEATPSLPASAEDAAPPAVKSPELSPEAERRRSVVLAHEYGQRVYGDEWPDKRGKICKLNGVGRIDSLNQEQLDGLLHHLKAKEIGLKN